MNNPIDNPVWKIKDVVSGKARVWVDVNYAASICEYLKSKNVSFTHFNKPIPDPAREVGISFRNFVRNEIVVEYEGDVVELLCGWSPPPSGL